MGSLSSRPKVPSTPSAVYVPTAATTATASTNTASTTTNTATETASPSKTGSAEAREQSLLTRGRGLYGTVKTSFLGLLGAGDPDQKKKTLLGQ